MTADQSTALEEWLEGRPEIIKTLARKYPPGTRVDCRGTIMWVISYGEDGSLGVTPVDPNTDYEGAIRTKVNICASCLSEAKDGHD